MRCNGVICRIKAEIDGTKYDVGPVKASEADKIAGWTGYTFTEWEVNLVDEGDPLAARAVLALFRLREGQRDVKFSDVEIEDLDSIDADLYDPQGRKVSIKRDEDGRVIRERGNVIFLFDGEPLDPPRPAVPAPTD